MSSPPSGAPDIDVAVAAVCVAVAGTCVAVPVGTALGPAVDVGVADATGKGVAATDVTLAGVAVSRIVVANAIGVGVTVGADSVGSPFPHAATTAAKSSKAVIQPQPLTHLRL